MVRTNTPFRIARDVEGDPDWPAGYRQAGNVNPKRLETGDLANRLNLTWQRRSEAQYRRARAGVAGRLAFADEAPETRPEEMPENIYDNIDDAGGHGPLGAAGSRIAGMLPASRGGWILGITAGLSIAVSIAFALDLVGPSDKLPSTRAGDASAEPGAGGDSRYDMMAAIDTIREDVGPKAAAAGAGAPAGTSEAAEEEAAVQAAQQDETPLVPKIVVTTRHEAPVPQQSSDQTPVGGVVVDSRTNLAASAGGEPLDPSSETIETGETIVELDQATGAAAVSVSEKPQDRLLQDNPQHDNPQQADLQQDGVQVSALSGPAAEQSLAMERPVSAAPTADTETAPETKSEAVLSAEVIERLLARGELLLLGGDVISARLIFLSAAEAGDPRGAWGVGMTYDPEVYDRLAVTGLTPDQAQADFWYKRAGGNAAFMTIEERVVAEKVAEQPVAAKPQPAVSAEEERHAACGRKYKSYNPQTGQYTSYTGVKRPCRLP